MYPRRVFINVNSYGADVGKNSLIISKQTIVYPEKFRKCHFLLGKQEKTPELAIWSGSDPWPGGLAQVFRSDSPASPKSAMITPPEFVINCNDFDEPISRTCAMHVAAESRAI